MYNIAVFCRVYEKICSLQRVLPRRLFNRKHRQAGIFVILKFVKFSCSFGGGKFCPFYTNSLFNRGYCVI